jgi:hypothetical protein
MVKILLIIRPTENINTVAKVLSFKIGDHECTDICFDISENHFIFKDFEESQFSNLRRLIRFQL